MRVQFEHNAQVVKYNDDITKHIIIFRIGILRNHTTSKPIDSAPVSTNLRGITETKNQTHLDHHVTIEFYVLHPFNGTTDQRLNRDQLGIKQHRTCRH